MGKMYVEVILFVRLLTKVFCVLQSRKCLAENLAPMQIVCLQLEMFWSRCSLTGGLRQTPGSNEKNHLGFAAGSGITPIMSIIKETLHSSAECSVCPVLCQ